eukprot:m.62486 g.62486  ORF g.62486 m.62486 type:complete len:53 (+) comp12408_c0_seq1:28-186(+)
MCACVGECACASWCVRAWVEPGVTVLLKERECVCSCVFDRVMSRSLVSVSLI